MAKYRCSVCGFIYDEEREGRPFSELSECPSAVSPPPPLPLGGTGGEAASGAGTKRDVSGISEGVRAHR